MLWPFSAIINIFTLTVRSHSAGIDFSRQNLTSTDVRFWRLKSIPALWGLIYAATCNQRVMSAAYYSKLCQGSKYKLREIMSNYSSPNIGCNIICIECQTIKLTPCTMYMCTPLSGLQWFEPLGFCTRLIYFSYPYISQVTDFIYVSSTILITRHVAFFDLFTLSHHAM